MTAPVRVEHRAAERRFVVELPEGEAELSYELSPGVIDLESTFVPGSARGKGVAGELVLAAMNHAREHGLKVIPTCWYVGSWLDRHPEFRRLLRD